MNRFLTLILWEKLVRLHRDFSNSPFTNSSSPFFEEGRGGEFLFSFRGVHEGEVVVGSERDKATFYQKQLPIEQNRRPLENDRFWNAK